MRSFSLYTKRWLQWHIKLSSKRTFFLNTWWFGRRFSFGNGPYIVPFQGRHSCFFRGGVSIQFFTISNEKTIPGKDQLKHILGCLVRFDTPRRQPWTHVCFVNSGPRGHKIYLRFLLGSGWILMFFLPRNQGIRSPQPQISYIQTMLEQLHIFNMYDTYICNIQYIYTIYADVITYVFIYIF